MYGIIVNYIHIHIDNRQISLFVIQGEIALVCNKPRQATVVNCGGRTILLELKRDDFVTLFAQEPFALAEIAIKLLQV